MATIFFPFFLSLSAEFQGIFDLFPNVHHLEVTNNNMEDYILQQSAINLPRVNQQYLMGATIKENSLTAWFNNQPYHTAPLTLNIMHNAIYHAYGGCSKCAIVVSNKPMPFTTQSRLEMLQAGNNMGFQLAFNTSFAMSFVSAFYILFYIKERVSRAKLLQFVSGVNVFTFWITALIWDYITFVITAIFSIATLAAFQEEGWSTFEELGRTFLILICFGFSMLPITYLAANLFTIPSTGFTRMAIFNIFSGVACFSTVFILSLDNFDLQDVAKGITWFFLIFPHFGLSVGLNNLNIINTLERTCSRCVRPACDPSQISFCENRDVFQWEDPGIARALTYMIVVGLVSFIMLLLKEYRVFEFMLYKCRAIVQKPQIPHSEDGFVDDDVMNEKNKIRNILPHDIKKHNLVVKDMTKIYNNFLAVNQLSVAVEQ